MCAYAARYGDYDMPDSDIPELRKRLANFNAIALRENEHKAAVEHLVSAPVFKVIDPTLLLPSEQYETITVEPEQAEPYLLLYSRRGNDSMQQFAERYAAENHLRVIEISLNARNAEKHTMRYDAGVEEFLGLVKNASIVITNSFHGMIFAVQFRRPFYIFSRKLCNNKIEEVLDLFGITDRMLTSGHEPEAAPIDYDAVHNRIGKAREESLRILRDEITTHIPTSI